MTETLSLFPPTLGGPVGLRYQADFVSAEEEQELVAHVRQLPLQPFQFGAYEGHRRVASFGWRYDYSARKLEKAQDIPAWLAPFVTRIEAFAGPGSGPIKQFCAPNIKKVSGSAGIATSRISTRSSGCRLRQPASSAFAAGRELPGSALRSRRSHGHFM